MNARSKVVLIAGLSIPALSAYATICWTTITTGHACDPVEFETCGSVSNVVDEPVQNVTGGTNIIGKDSYAPAGTALCYFEYDCKDAQGNCTNTCYVDQQTPNTVASGAHCPGHGGGPPA